MPSSLPKQKVKASKDTPVEPLLSQIPKLEAALLKKPYNPNPLLELVALSRHTDAEVVHKTIWALHRVFVEYINEGQVGGITGVNSKGKQVETSQDLELDSVGEGKEVKAWVRDRLLEYVEVLGGLLRDSETSLRSSALKLLFSLLAPLSHSISPDEHTPVIHIPYFRIILNYILLPVPSLRGAKPSKSQSSSQTNPWIVHSANQVDLEEGTIPGDVAKEVSDEFWAKYDDLRWAFFRESKHFLENEELPHPENLLSQLLPLTNLPRVQVDLNTFYIPSFSSSPSSLSNGSSKKQKTTTPPKKKKKATKEVETLPEWMQTYESDAESSDDEGGVGKKRGRTSQLSVHAAIHSIPSHQSVYTALWEQVLSKVALDESWTRKILIALHGESGILGHLKPERRIRVADWLGGLVDGGGALAMLAMNGLFVLMTKYNLDYPQFYQRLYALLDRHVLHVKYRARFFRLLDTFLRSSLLPAAMVASFIKRLSRLSLTAPPAAIIMLIPFIYNLFKRHPGCMVMIQRHADDTPEDGYKDPYNAEDPSPFTSNAISSSLWELASLQTHYLSSVSTLAKIFQEVFTKPEFNMEDFLDHGYSTLFETEMNRKLKTAPAMAMAIEMGEVVDPFLKEKVETSNEDIVAQLWAF